MESVPLLAATVSGEQMDIVASGSWTASYAGQVDLLVAELERRSPQVRKLTIDVTSVDALDTFGAWLLERLLRDSAGRGQEAKLAGVPERYRGLIEEVHQVNRAPVTVDHRSRLAMLVETTDRGLASLHGEVTAFLAMLGAIGAALGRAALRPSSFRVASAVHHIDRAGWQAVGIVLLITFLMGGIIAQQGILHFRRFGAEDYVVDLVGILVLREIGVLIVAIMVAGRSGSSYTAELGSMKMREEIDALRTMGLDPVAILVLPRVVALMLALPVLTFLGAMAALYGGGLVAWLYGGMSPEVFVARLKEAISVTHFQVGMTKAPFMALMIGVVAATEGLRVQGSAESLGLKTTTSVVKSIFLVIVLDGLFAVFFASIGM